MRGLDTPRCQQARGRPQRPCGSLLRADYQSHNISEPGYQERTRSLNIQAVAAENSSLQFVRKEGLVFFLGLVRNKGCESFWLWWVFQKGIQSLTYIGLTGVVENERDPLVMNFEAGLMPGEGHERALNTRSGPGEPKEFAPTGEE